MKFDIEKFIGKNNFSLWKEKMKAILIQQGVKKALLLEESLLIDMPTKDKVKMANKAYSSIILCLSDQVLRQISKEKNVVAIWKKLEELYKKKALSN